MYDANLYIISVSDKPKVRGEHSPWVKSFLYGYIRIRKERISDRKGGKSNDKEMFIIHTHNTTLASDKAGVGVRGDHSRGLASRYNGGPSCGSPVHIYLYTYS